jgi:hypothetical protein
MKETMQRFSSLGRPVDPAYPTNRAIATLSLLVAACGFGIRRLGGAPSPESFLWGVTLALAFFLAWAVARELDPDHDRSAFVAAGLSLIPHAVLGRPDFVAVLLVLVVVRTVNRTVGPAARPLDTLAVLGLVGISAWRGHPVLAAAAAAGLALDATLKPPHRVHLAAAGAAIALLGVGLGRSAAGTVGLGLMDWAALAATLPFFALVRASGQPRTMSDREGLPLAGTRVRAGQCLAWATLAGIVLFEGRVGLAALSPVWAALVGTGAYFSIGAPTRLPHSVQDPS